MAIVNAHVAAVQELYVAYFNRPADYAGLDYWTNVVAANNGDTTAVSAAFAAEAEYKTEYAGMTNAQIVNQVYQNLFGRDAEAAGQTYWADLLTSGAITIDKVVAEIANGALTTDAEAYENKVVGATAFTAALDTAAEQAGYRGAAANTAAKAFVSSITTDASLATVTAPAALAASVAGVVAAGTPFTLTSGLAALAAAQEARLDFLAAADGDDDADTSATEADITGAVTNAVTALDVLVTGDYATASAAVRAALVADQIAANAAALNTAQTAVTAANTEIGKVAGLSAAISTEAAAKTAVSAASKTVTAAAADLAAKEASYEVLNTTATTSVELSVAADGTVTAVKTTDGVAAAATDLIVLKDGKLALADGVTEAKNPGVGALLSSTTAKEAADTALTNANKALEAATDQVNYLDRTATEVSDLQALANAMTDVDVAEGALPTLAQIATQQAILQAKADAGDTAAASALTNFNSLIATYEGNAIVNTRVDALTTATADVTAATKVITDLTKATTALADATATAAELTAANAAITAANKAFTDNDLTTPNEVGVSEIATAASDIFTVGSIDGSISLFGLQGNDSLYIGTDYTLNPGKVTAGNNSVLEAFITASGSDTIVTLETSVFGSNASTPEVVTITLVGVAPEDVVLNNGIITMAPSA